MNRTTCTIALAATIFTAACGADMSEPLNAPDDVASMAADTATHVATTAPVPTPTPTPTPTETHDLTPAQHYVGLAVFVSDLIADEDQARNEFDLRHTAAVADGNTDAATALAQERADEARELATLAVSTSMVASERPPVTAADTALRDSLDTLIGALGDYGAAQATYISVFSQTLNGEDPDDLVTAVTNAGLAWNHLLQSLQDMVDTGQAHVA